MAEITRRRLLTGLLQVAAALPLLGIKLAPKREPAPQKRKLWIGHRNG